MRKNGLPGDPKVTQYGNHMVMTNVALPTKTKYLTIDTRFRDEYDSSTLANYTISLPDRINDVKSIRVQSANIPITFYNISANRGNNVFTLSILNKRVTIILPDRQYDACTLVSVINSEITLMTSPFNSITFSIDNHRGIFTNSGDKNDCTVNFEISKSSLGVPNPLSTFGWLLGYRKSSYVISPNSAIHGEAFVSLIGPRYIYLIVDEFKNGNPHSFVCLSRTSELSSQQILARISMDYTNYPFGSILSTDDSGYCCTDTRRYANEINIQRMNVRLVDELGTILDLNGMDFSFCMELHHL